MWRILRGEKDRESVAVVTPTRKMNGKRTFHVMRTIRKNVLNGVNQRVEDFYTVAGSSPKQYFLGVLVCFRSS